MAFKNDVMNRIIDVARATNVGSVIFVVQIAILFILLLIYALPPASFLRNRLNLLSLVPHPFRAVLFVHCR